jgi:hypothetical protein
VFWFSYVLPIDPQYFSEKNVPVVLSVRRDCVPQLRHDYVGSRDAEADAFTTDSAVPACILRLWTGSTWAKLNSYSRVERKNFWEGVATSEELESGFVPDPTISRLFPPEVR